MTQLSFYDLVNDKDRAKMTPEVWSCVETCGNFTNVNSDNSLDYFPETNTPRCTRMCFKSKLIDNVWHTICTNYKPREDT